MRGRRPVKARTCPATPCGLAGMARRTNHSAIDRRFIAIAKRGSYLGSHSPLRSGVCIEQYTSRAPRPCLGRPSRLSGFLFARRLNSTARSHTAGSAFPAQLDRVSTFRRHFSRRSAGNPRTSTRPLGAEAIGENRRCDPNSLTPNSSSEGGSNSKFEGEAPILLRFFWAPILPIDEKKVWPRFLNASDR